MTETEPKPDETNNKQQEQSSLPPTLFGRYRLETSENFDAFLKEIGIGFLNRKLAGLASPDLNIIKEDDGVICMKVGTPFKSQVNRFKINEWFDEQRMDGKIVQSKVEFFPPNKFVQQQCDDKLQIKYIREFIDDKIHVRSICNNVESVRIYKRLPDQ